MQQASRSPYEGKLCRVMIKSRIVYKGQFEDMYVEAKVSEWAREGIYLDDGNFIPWSNISSVAPLEPLDAQKAGDKQAVELTKDEIWYLWALASDDYAIDRDEKTASLRASALKKLLPFVHPEVLKE